MTLDVAVCLLGPKSYDQEYLGEIGVAGTKYRCNSGENSGKLQL